MPVTETQAERLHRIFERLEQEAVSVMRGVEGAGYLTARINFGVGGFPRTGEITLSVKSSDAEGWVFRS